MDLIEIDGLPFLIKMVDLSMANCECHKQRGHGIIGDLLLTQWALHLGDLAHLAHVAICGTETMAFSAPNAAPSAWSTGAKIPCLPAHT